MTEGCWPLPYSWQLDHYLNLGLPQPSAITAPFLPTTVMKKNYLLSCRVKAKATWLFSTCEGHSDQRRPLGGERADETHDRWGEHSLLTIGREEPPCAAVTTAQDTHEACPASEGYVHISL